MVVVQTCMCSEFQLKEVKFGDDLLSENKSHECQSFQVETLNFPFQTCDFYAKRQQHENAVITSKMALETELQPFNSHDQLVNGNCVTEIGPDRKEELRR